MKFFEWTTDYDCCKYQTPDGSKIEYEEFFESRSDQLRESNSPLFRTYDEDVWIREGKPYYNIHPKLVKSLCKVDMSKIPTKLIKMPGDLNSVNIRLAQKHDEFVLHDTIGLDIDNTNSNSKLLAGSYVHGILMTMNKVEGDENKKEISFLVDFGLYTDNHRQPIYLCFGFSIMDKKSLKDSIFDAVKNRPESYYNVLGNVARLCVSVGFLSNNPTVCEPDVLSKDRPEFNRSDDERREFLANRARRRGKVGFNIGSDLMFMGESSSVSRKTGESTGRELEYSHIRGGHPHLVRYGKGKNLIKMMWYLPQHVRPDKPFKNA